MMDFVSFIKTKQFAIAQINSTANIVKIMLDTTISVQIIAKIMVFVDCTTKPYAIVWVTGLVKHVLHRHFVLVIVEFASHRVQ